MNEICSYGQILKAFIKSLKMSLRILKQEREIYFIYLFIYILINKLSIYLLPFGEATEAPHWPTKTWSTASCVCHTSSY